MEQVSRRVASWLIVCGTLGSACTAGAQALTTRPAMAGLDGPFADHVRGYQSAGDHVTMAMRYRYAQSPLALLKPDRTVFCHAVESDHGADVHARVHLTDHFSMGIAGSWTVARSGCAGFEHLQAAGMGDMTVSATLYTGEVLKSGPADPLLGNTVTLYWGIPTGATEQYLGSGSAGGILASSEVVAPWYGAVFNLGLEVRAPVAGGDAESLFRYGGGISLHTRERLLGFALEWTGGYWLGGDVYASGVTASLFHDRKAWFVRASAGTDVLGSVVGTSPFRAMVDLGFTR